MAVRSSLTPPSPAWLKSATAAGQRPSSWTSPQQALPRSLAPNSPHLTCANLDPSGTGTRSAKSTSPSQGPYPGPTPPLPPHPPCTWAEPGQTWPGPRPKSPPEDIPGSHLSLPANSTLDSTRAPSGDHILWTYTHVPAGSTLDTTEMVIRRVEQFAPGFRDVILATHSFTAQQYSQYNPNYIGGDFSAGALSARQLLKRPVISSDPWRTPAKGVYLCSSSTPPGPSVHGLCGWYAAQSAPKREFGLPSPQLSYQRRRGAGPG